MTSQRGATEWREALEEVRLALAELYSRIEALEAELAGELDQARAASTLARRGQRQAEVQAAVLEGRLSTLQRSNETLSRTMQGLRSELLQAAAHAGKPPEELQDLWAVMARERKLRERLAEVVCSLRGVELPSQADEAVAVACLELAQAEEAEGCEGGEQ